MKKLWRIMALTLCLAMLYGCGNAAANTQEADSTQENEAVIKAQEEARLLEEAKAEEEAKALEEAKKAEEEKAAKEAEEVKKAEEEKAAKEAEEAKAAEEAAKEALLADGLAEDVDREQIVKFDEPKTMYLQKAANVRKGPSTEYEKVDYFQVNTEVSAVGRYGEKGWYLIEYKDGNAFISNGLLGENEVDLDALKAQQEAAAMAAIAQAQANDQAAAQAQQAASAAAAQAATSQEQVQAAAVQPVMAPAGILFIGDSRCVQMQEATGGGGCSWVCEGGKGYDWFTSKAMERAEPSIGKGTKVVICLGVNDPGNANRYAAFANQKAAEWAARGAVTYFVSVNPVSDNPWTSQEQVALFNSCVAPQLAGIRWIDTNSVLTANGYTMVDGMHFDYNTNVTVFNLIVGSLR